MADFDKARREDDLIVNLMGTLVNNAHETGQTLLDLKEREITRLRAELNIIRNRVLTATDGPYAPSTVYLREVLFPSDDAIKRGVENGMGEWNYDR